MADRAQPRADDRVITLGTDTADPLERLASICQQAAAAPAGSVPLHLPLAACSLTELAGPAAPQFLCGARLTLRSVLRGWADCEQRLASPPRVTGLVKTAGDGRVLE